MARTSGEVFITEDRLNDNKSILNMFISKMKEDKQKIFVDMITLFDYYISPDNQGVINAKASFINAANESFVTGEEKVVTVLIPDVVKRFHEGLRVTFEEMAKIKSINDSELDKTTHEVVSDVSEVDEDIESIPSLDKASLENFDGFNVELEASKEIVDDALMDDVNDVSVMTSTSDINNDEEVSYVVAAVTNSDSIVDIRLGVRVDNVNKVVEQLTANVSIPKDTKVSTIVLNLDDSISKAGVSYPNQVDDGSIVVTPLSFNPQATISLVKGLQMNPAHVLSGVSSEVSNSINFDSISESLPGIEVVSSGSDNSDLEMILDNEEFADEIKAVNILGTSSVDFDEYPSIAKVMEKVTFQNSSELNIGKR